MQLKQCRQSRRIRTCTHIAIIIPLFERTKKGEFWNSVVGAVVGAAIGATTQIISNVASGNNWTDGVGTAEATGAASGLLAASGVGLAGAVSGAISGSGMGKAVNIRTLNRNLTKKVFYGQQMWPKKV